MVRAINETGASMTMKDDPELLATIDAYRRGIGWTWKRLWLIGIADTIDKNGDAPDLVVRIVNYLTTKR